MYHLLLKNQLYYAEKGRRKDKQPSPGGWLLLVTSFAEIGIIMTNSWRLLIESVLAPFSVLSVTY